MTRFAKTFGRWAVLALVLALLFPATPAAGDKAKSQAPTAAKVAAVKPAPAVKPSQPPASPQPPAPSASPEAPAPPESTAAEPDSGESEGGEESLPDEAGDGDKVAVLNDVEVPAGQEVRGDLVCIGGNVNLLGKVRGDVIVVAGKLDMHGSANGGVVGVGSKLTLHPGASVRKDLVNVGGGLDRDGATVGGQVFNIGSGGRWLAHMPGPFGILGFFLFWLKLLKLVLVFIGLLVLTALAPERIRLLSEEAPLHPFLAFFAGLGGYIVLVLTMILLCITCIGIPAAILLYFAFVVVKWMGLAGIFHEVGKRIGRLMGRDFSLLGAVLLGFLPFAILRFLPFFIGTLIWFVLDVMAVGLMILTRFGGKRYGASTPPPVPAPPAPLPTAPAAPTP